MLRLYLTTSFNVFNHNIAPANSMILSLFAAYLLMNAFDSYYHK